MARDEPERLVQGYWRVSQNLVSAGPATSAIGIGKRAAFPECAVGTCFCKVDAEPTSRSESGINRCGGPSRPHGRADRCFGSTAGAKAALGSPSPAKLQRRCPALNLYLVRDNDEGGETYLYKLPQPCLRPGGGGSCSWAVPKNFSGAGFRILGATPGGMAYALRRPFSIE